MRRSRILPVFISMIMLASIGFAPELYATDYDLGLIEVEDLQQQFDRWVVLDARPAELWTQGHLPGSFSFHWRDYTRTDAAGVRYCSWSPQELAEALGGMGIAESTPVVVYADAETSWGGEGWTAWLLVQLGHRGPVRLLNGGFQGWRQSGLPLSAGREVEEVAPRRYRIAVRPEVAISSAELHRQLDSVTLIDTRSWWEWFTGHLPGAVHLPWHKLVTGPENRPVSAIEYRRLFASLGISEDRPVVFYCSGGVRSGFAWLVHHLSGFGPAKNYEGGMEAWQHYRAD